MNREQALNEACKRGGIYAAQAVAVMCQQLKVDPDDAHIVLAIAASSLFSVAAFNLARKTGQNLPPNHPRIVALYKAWGRGMQLFPDHEAVGEAFTKAREAFLDGTLT